MSQPKPIELHSVPSQPAPKRATNWVIAAAVVLAAIGVFFYKQSNYLKHAVSPLEPAPAHQQVPIDKDMESQVATPVAVTPALAAVAPATPGSTIAPAASSPLAVAAPDAVAPAQNIAATATSAETAQILNRLTKIEDAIQALSNAIAKLAADFATWTTAGRPSSEKLAASKSEDGAVVVKHKRARRQIVKPPVSVIAAEPSPELLAVDTWNGKPSVVVRNASGVQFLSEGDQAGSFTLKRADNDGQRVVFTDQAGAITVQQKSNR